MKKVVTALALSISALTSSAALAQEPVELRFSWWGGNTRHQQTLEAIKAFEAKYPNIDIKAEYSGWDGYLTRLTSQIAGKTEPDIMQLNWSWLNDFSPRGKGFYDLSNLKNLDLSGYSEQNLKPNLRNGSLNAMTVSMSGWVYYYNKNTWEKAGISYPETWDQLLQAGSSFKQKLGDDYYPLSLNERDIILTIQSQLIQKYGLAMIDTDRKKIAYSNEQLVEFFDHYKELVDNHVIPDRKRRNAFGNANVETLKPWINGQWAGAFPPNPVSNEMEKFLDNGQKLELGPFIQSPESTESGAFYRPSMVFGIGKNTKHPEETALFMDFMLHDKEAMNALSDVRGIPFSQNSYKHLVEQGVLDKDSLNYKGFLQLENLTYKTVITPYIESEQLSKTFLSIIENMDYNSLSSEQAAKEFRRKAERILRKSIKS